MQETCAGVCFWALHDASYQYTIIFKWNNLSSCASEIEWQNINYRWYCLVRLHSRDNSNPYNITKNPCKFQPWSVVHVPSTRNPGWGRRSPVLLFTIGMGALPIITSNVHMLQKPFFFLLIEGILPQWLRAPRVVKAYSISYLRRDPTRKSKSSPNNDQPR